MVVAFSIQMTTIVAGKSGHAPVVDPLIVKSENLSSTMTRRHMWVAQEPSETPSGGRMRTRL